MLLGECFVDPLGLVPGRRGGLDADRVGKAWGNLMVGAFWSLGETTEGSTIVLRFRGAVVIESRPMPAPLIIRRIGEIRGEIRLGRGYRSTLFPARVPLCPVVSGGRSELLVGRPRAPGLPPWLARGLRPVGPSCWP